MDVIRALQAFAPALNDIMFFITNLGSERAYIILLLVAYLAVDARVGRLLGIALLSSFYLNFMLKGIIDTPRPFVLEPSLSLGEKYDATGIGAGFPSGHAQASTTFWGLAAVFVKRAWFWLLAVVIILLIGLSRMYFALHLPIDVIGGIVIGIAVILLALALFRATEAAALAKGLIIGLGILVPLMIHLTIPTLMSLSIPESDLLMGGLAAFITGPVMYKHQVAGKLWQRGLLALLGIVLAFVFLIGSSLVLPEEAKRNAIGGFIRYLVLGYVGVLLTPWLGRALRLVPHATPKTHA